MSTSTVPQRAGSARILMVDDNRSGLAARKAVLEEMGHRVTAATRVEDALEQFAKTQFDLVITDHHLTKVNGVALIGKIRDTQSNVPIILLSGYVDALGLTEPSTGADLVLSKSANEVANLIRAVTRLLRPKTARKPPGSLRTAAKAQSLAKTPRR